MNEADVIRTKKTGALDLKGKSFYLFSLLPVTAFLILINLGIAFSQEDLQVDERSKKIDAALEAQSRSNKIIKKFVINGDTIITPQDFDTVLSKYRDKELSPADLQKAADEITSLYRKKGYIVNLSYVAEQGAGDNTVEFKVAGSGIKEAKAEKAKEKKIEPKTLIKKFVINGDTLFTPQDFEVVLSKYRDRELGLSDLQKAVAELTDLYRKKGYILTLVYIPEQEIVNNTVEFRVIESRVGEIQIEKPKYSKLDTEKNKILLERGQVLD